MTTMQRLATHGISRFMQLVSETTIPQSWREPILRKFGDAYGVDWAEVPDQLSNYKKFADFFSRGLPDGARQTETGKKTITSPVDGAVHSVVEISDGQMFQIKGQHYSATDFLGPYGGEAKDYEGGTAITIYLRPKDYHHVHAPIDCTVTDGCVVPGTLWPVNPWANKNVRKLYSKNERVGMRLLPKLTHPDGPNSTEAGGATAANSIWYFMVGALCVGGIETVFCYRPKNSWHGPIREGLTRKSGDELGQFLFGSTVVMLWPKSLDATFDVDVGDELRLGQAIGTMNP